MKFDPFVLGNSNTKMTIIHILDTLGPLSAKKIHSRLKDEGISISYQAAHKALKKMNEDNVLLLDEKMFCINPEWVSRMRSFIDHIEKDPDCMKDIFSRLDSGKTVSFTVNTDMEMGYFVLDFAYWFNKRYSSDKGPLLLNFHFMWTILPLSDKQFNMFKEIVKKRGVYVTSHEGSVYDNIMKRHWELRGAKVEVGVPDCVSNSEVVVIGDYVINIFWDPKHLKSNIDFTKTVKDEKSFDYNEFYKELCAPTNTEFVIIKNKQVAENLRKKTLKCFSQRA